MGRALLVIVLVGACGFTPGKLTGDAPQPLIDSDVDAVPDASTCTMQTAECIGDTLRQCAGAGATATDTFCGWGCDATGAGRCKTITPTANALVVGDLAPDASLTDLNLVAGIIFDTTDGRIGTSSTPTAVRGAGTGVIAGISFEVRNTGGINVGVFRVKSLHVTIGAAGVPLQFNGFNAVAIVADGDIVVDGVIDARGTCSGAAPGPGGYAGGTAKGPGAGPGGGGANTTNHYAGGGGGHAGVGGAGASDTVGTTVPGGAIFGDATIMTLEGGGGGGGGAGGGVAAGGGGGGAIQLVSNRLISIVSGGINAGGCGGETKTGGNDGGGGGGAGGTILLEAPAITLGATATLAVNGGGGGGGDAATAGTGLSGQLSRTPAVGDLGTVGGDGGAGAAGTVANGADGTIVATKAGGGGGGAIGRIRFHTRDDTGLTLHPASVLSPSFTDSTPCSRGAATVQ